MRSDTVTPDIGHLELPVEELLRRARPMPPHEEMSIEHLDNEEGAAIRWAKLRTKSPLPRGHPLRLRPPRRQTHRQKRVQALSAERSGRLSETGIDAMKGHPHRPHQKGKAHHCTGERRRRPGEGYLDAEAILEKAAQPAAPTKQHQQKIARDDRRQH